MKRAKILVIDDEGFPYISLFRRDGYTIELWEDIDDLQALESSAYDLILLDLRGVGRAISAAEGFGVLRYLRRTSPAQMVVAYSNADLSLAYQPFFEEADATLHKTTDYVEFKRTVNELLEKRFSLGFYLDRIGTELGDLAPQAPKVRKKARQAILYNDIEPLRSYLVRRIEDKVTVDRVIALVSAGAQVAALWKT